MLYNITEELRINEYNKVVCYPYLCRVAETPSGSRIRVLHLLTGATADVEIHDCISTTNITPIPGEAGLSPMLIISAAFDSSAAYDHIDIYGIYIVDLGEFPNIKAKRVPIPLPTEFIAYRTTRIFYLYSSRKNSGSFKRTYYNQELEYLPLRAVWAGNDLWLVYEILGHLYTVYIDIAGGTVKNTVEFGVRAEKAWDTTLFVIPTLSPSGLFCLNTDYGATELLLWYNAEDRKIYRTFCHTAREHGFGVNQFHVIGGGRDTYIVFVKRCAWPIEREEQIKVYRIPTCIFMNAIFGTPTTNLERVNELCNLSGSAEDFIDIVYLPKQRHELQSCWVDVLNYTPASVGTLVTRHQHSSFRMLFPYKLECVLPSCSRRFPEHLNLGNVDYGWV